MRLCAVQINAGCYLQCLPLFTFLACKNNCSAISYRRIQNWRDNFMCINSCIVELFASKDRLICRKLRHKETFMQIVLIDEWEHDEHRSPAFCIYPTRYRADASCFVIYASSSRISFDSIEPRYRTRVIQNNSCRDNSIKLIGKLRLKSGRDNLWILNSICRSFSLSEIQMIATYEFISCILMRELALIFLLTSDPHPPAFIRMSFIRDLGLT